MNRAIIHRGPDDEGYFEQGNFGFAMRRLSIIDIETGHQPIFSADRQHIIVFNGEIYNYRELKKKYLQNYSFATHSDTEVVLNLYHKMGEKCLEHLRGIFAFAVYDINRRHLFIARDQIGIKPLYYYSDEHHFLFSSDILSFHALPFLDLSINHAILGDYLRFGYIPQPATIFRKVHALRPGHYAYINNQAQVSVNRYYNLSERIDTSNDQDFTISKDKLRCYLHESVVEQLVSDVPLGAFLSGGIDSSIITYEMTSASTDPVKTFTIGFHGASNNKDIELSALLSSQLSTRHTERVVKPDLNEVINKIIDSLGQPFAITSALPIYINSLVAREKVKVVLSGDGADEVFGGYKRYQRFFNYKNLEWLRFLPLAQINDLSGNIVSRLRSEKFNKVYRLKINQFLSFFSYPDDLHKYLHLLGADNDKLLNSIMNRDELWLISPPAYAQEFTRITEQTGLNLNSLMLFDIETSLVDEMLSKVDFASMLASLEVRVPFLDHRMVEFGLSLPEEFKVHSSTNKHLLKEAYKEILPSEILNAPKRGFNLPLDNWIKNHWTESFRETFNNPILNELGFERFSINRHFDDYVSGYPMSGKVFYYLYLLARWYEKFKSRNIRNEF